MCDISPICSNTVDNEIRNILKWNQICDSDICEYKSCTYTLSRDIVLPNEVLLCRDTKCSIHNQDLDSFYNSIMSVFKQATCTIECIPSSSNCNKNFVPIPGGNEYVKEHHKIARDAFKWWNLNNRLRDGYIYHEMKSSGARFKYALRFTRSIEDTARIQTNTIDGCSGAADIADFWKNHFSKLLNAHCYDATLKTSLMSKFNKVLYCNDMLILSSLISEAIKELKCGKSACPDGVYAESIKFAHPRLHVLLSICFSLCVTHGYIPVDMMETTIVPIIKIFFMYICEEYLLSLSYF